MLQIIAHRGASAYQLENTISAANKAVELGADLIELDLRLTSDNKIVVFHDPDTQRLANTRLPIGLLFLLKKKISSLSLADVQKIHLINNEKIDELETFIQVLPTSIGFDFDVKEIEVIAPLYHLIKKYKLHTRIMVTSFNQSIVRMMNILDPKVKTALIVRFRKKGLYIAKQLGVSYIVVHKNFLVNSSFFAEANKLHLGVYVYGVSSPPTIKKLQMEGVRGIITPRPDVVRRALEVEP